MTTGLPGPANRPTAETDPHRTPSGRRRLIWTRFKRNRGAATGLVLLALLFALAYLTPLLYPWNHTELDYTAFQQPPSSRHWFGTDSAGADVYAATMRGMQRSLTVGLLTGAIATALATLVGGCAGYFGRGTDRVLMGLVSMMLVLPSFLIVAVVAGRIGGRSWMLFVLLLAGFSWMLTGRVVRDMIHTLRSAGYVQAAEYAGVPAHSILTRHMLPAIASLLIIDATLQVGAAVIGEAGLSYFGFGVQPPDVSLGGVIAAGTPAAVSFPWLFYFPAALLFLVCLSVFLIGDGLRDALDPGAPAAKKRLTSPNTRHRNKRIPPRPRPQKRPNTPHPGPDITPPGTAPALEVTDLHVSFPSEGQPVQAVKALSFVVAEGENLGIIGESGSGKSTVAAALMGLLPDTATTHGSVKLLGREIHDLPDRDLSAIRGKEIALIPQDPRAALTPVYTLGEQISEALRTHQTLDKKAARARAIELLDLVGVPEPNRRADAFPHECSGGICQRAVIAMAIANNPKVLIADEPTSSLDTIAQAQILDVLKKAALTTGAALVLITHDLGTLAGIADHIQVMYAGKAVERGPAEAVYHRPLMPYTIGLLGAVPRPELAADRPLQPIDGSAPPRGSTSAGCPFADRCPIVLPVCRQQDPPLTTSTETAPHAAACHRAPELHLGLLDRSRIYPTPHVQIPGTPPPSPRQQRPVALQLDGLVRHFPVLRGALLRKRVGTVRAVDGVDLDIRAAEALALIGESGCGKSTMLRTIADSLTTDAGRRTHEDEQGTVTLFGHKTANLNRNERAQLRRDVQIVFQDPSAALDPRMPVVDLLAEPLRAQAWRPQRISERVEELLDLVGLDAEHASRFPSELSGGQRQRVNIGRALAPSPRLLLLDEPVSALDVSVQASMLNLLGTLRQGLSLSYLFVAHDLAVARYVADRVAIMYLGRIVEIGKVQSVFSTPAHPYTHALWSAAPVPDPATERRRPRIQLANATFDAANIPTGCRFRPRCPRYATLQPGERLRCEQQDPHLRDYAHDHAAACHFAGPSRDEEWSSGQGPLG
ncbi:dipeptide ABC transporter ATP-binding protein [Streptomyces sp. NPDC004435]|uniref:dipeptide ABC transporter ATP-binding protein n=1 Tax=Streptomyces sp. NPDC004435 TaxID=3364701 RepID=UPI0036B96BC6